MSASFIRRRGAGIGLAVVVLATAGAWVTRNVDGGGAGVATAAQASLSRVETVESPSDAAIGPQSVADVLVDVAAARQNHDNRALAGFRGELTRLVGAAAVRAAEATVRETLANLDAAVAAHDTRARAIFRAQLRQLCDPTNLASAFEACELDAAAVGG